MCYLTMHSTHFNTVIWRRTYGKEPYIYREREREREREGGGIPAAATICATLSDYQQGFFYMRELSYHGATSRNK